METLDIFSIIRMIMSLGLVSKNVVPAMYVIIEKLKSKFQSAKQQAPLLLPDHTG